MIKTRKGTFQLCMAASFGFIILALPMEALNPSNQVPVLGSILFGLFIYLLGFTIDNRLELEEIRNLVNTSSKESPKE